MNIQMLFNNIIYKLTQNITYIHIYYLFTFILFFNIGLLVIGLYTMFMSCLYITLNINNTTYANQHFIKNSSYFANQSY